MYADHAAGAAARERRFARQVLRDSASARMLANVAEGHWPLTSGEDLASEAETDAEYFRRRSGEESQAAEKANGLAARTAHQELADLHRLVSRVAGNGTPQLRFGTIERREALLDDALDDSFPASDPPAIIAPGDPARWH